MGKKKRKSPVGISVQMEVLTKTKGWLTCDKINNLEIACLKDGKLIYEKPEKVSIFEDFEGLMYTFENSIFDFKVSGNYPLYFKNKNSEDIIEQADKLQIIRKEGEFINFQNNVLYEAVDYQFIIPGCDEQILMEPWLIFFGIFFTNGLIDITDDNDKVVVRINNKNVEKELLKSLDRLNYDWSFCYDKGYDIYKKPDWELVIINNKQLKEYLKTLDVQILPDWVLNLSNTQTSLLLAGILCHTGKFECFTSLTQKLADQIQQLCLHSSFHSIIVKDNDYFVINISTNENENYVPEKEFLEKQRCGIFNVIISPKVFYIRKNGKPMWI
jgi:hypothetical protein